MPDSALIEDESPLIPCDVSIPKEASVPKEASTSTDASVVDAGRNNEQNTSLLHQSSPQRIPPLSSALSPTIRTRFGREIKKPVKFDPSSY